MTRLIDHFEQSNRPAAADPESGDVLVTDPRGHSSRYTLDENGFVNGFVTPLNRRYSIDNTSRGNAARITNPAGCAFSLEYDPADRVSRMLRDSDELCGFDYDELGRLSTVTYYDGTATQLKYHRGVRIASVTNRLGHTESFEYGDADELLALTDGNGHRTSFEYSQWDRPVRAFLPDGIQEVYRYDAAGHVTYIQDGTEPVVEIAYDDRDNPTEFLYGDDRKVAFEYGEHGLPIKATNESSVVQFEYDQEGRVVAEDQGGRVVKFTYDAAGNVVELTYPNGKMVTFSYDADQRLTAVTDWNGGLHRFSYKPEDGGYEFRTAEELHVDVVSFPSGLPASYVATSATSVKELFSSRFEYDREGRLTSATDSEFGGRRFEYDAEGQLVAATNLGPVPAESFRYDGAGNRVSSGGGAGVFNSTNQLVTYGATSCQYDGRGNMATLRVGERSWEWTYNHQNLLTAARGPRGEHVSFTYDAFGRRTTKRVLQETGEVIETRYVWAGEHLIAEETVLDGGVRSQEFVYHPGTHTPLLTCVDGTVYHYHCDPKGTPVRITDGAGRVVWAAVSSAFGECHPVVANVPNPLRFPGQYHDSETGLYYNRFRYYSPQLGRYLSRDPLSFLGGPNLYAYVGNDPINRSDPLGLWWKAALSVVAGVAAAAVVVVTAPVSLPALAVAAGAAAIGVGVGVGVNKALNMKDFCALCALKAFGEGFVKGALLAGGLIAAAVAFPAAATGIAVAAAGVGIYSMLQEHFGWELFPWEKGSKSYFEMTPQEQSESLGGLAGWFAGAAATGVVANKFVLPRIAEARARQAAPPEERPGQVAPRTTREQALQDVQNEIKAKDIDLVTGDEATEYLDYRARQMGMDPKDVHASTMGDTVIVRPEHADNPRVLREEVIHVEQNRAGKGSSDRIVQNEIEAREQMIRNKDEWGITDSEAAEMQNEIDIMKKTGRY